ncbi:hypothetical protein VUJ46_17130 [Chryseobacterium sp. MYb264]|uniref:hypothetical protein n=1 Tax=Chryseobacterium sp. MYb264 TaxID=2745153 RepID=UPI002E152320|nr:hypothetical protein VUJ46_17130 [Chryseobacterium sp. MYb264]
MEVKSTYCNVNSQRSQFFNGKERENINSCPMKTTSENEALRKLKIHPLKNSHCPKREIYSVTKTDY